uniref:CAAX prenyl protease 2/Lysostaphin resistance protein A-like domain-containing protein n=2 Tax=Rhodosorus marinus TaxID=101924 RepID=A0A7S3EIP0_9RHOD|mmetsp:Transcript_39022/g.154558  ORF Transcript_39022/g.154558 Transcript_39022/m.154558 type:complete len:408 (+) Transcript_39022:494-1717(+)
MGFVSTVRVGKAARSNPLIRPRPFRTYECRREFRGKVRMTGSDLPMESTPPAVPDEESATTLENQRPKWAPEWLPDWVINPNPWLQLAILLPLYAVHLFYFSKKGWPLPFKFLAKDKGGHSLGNNLENLTLDSVVGFLVLAGTLVWRKAMKLEPLVPNLLKSDNPPWEVPKGLKVKLLTTIAFLITAFVLSGYGAVFCEQILLLLSVYGVPLTIPTMRAWKVLLGHLMWVYMGVKILGQQLKPFFPPKGKWIGFSVKSNWVWWSIGGYYASSFLFNCADIVNQLVIPQSLFNEETVVSKLVNPENNDLVAMLIGSLGPCISAPVFEEILYRGFLLPTLVCYMPMHFAIPASSILFAAHHLNICGVLPLSVLGFAWAIIYTFSRNLLTTILIHAMWNSRVFLGSLLGL